MIFKETKYFTKRIEDELSHFQYMELQKELIKKPDSGKIIAGSGGLRKLRWAAKGKGKSGGVRIIYYLFDSEEIIYMLFVYPKNEQADLTADQIKILKKLVIEELS